MDCSRCQSDPRVNEKLTKLARIDSEELREKEIRKIIHPAIVQDLCEDHYHQVFVTPLIKERQVSQNIVDDLTRQIQYRLTELHKAKNIDRLSSEEAAKRMLERQKRVQRGELVALGYQYCAKCHAPFELSIERIMHEEDCHVLNPAKQGKVRAKRESVTVTSPVIELELEDMT